MPGPAAPMRGRPIVAVIDNLARPEYVIGLAGGCRIGHLDLIIDAKFVACADARIRDSGGEPTITAAHHRGGARRDDGDLFRRGRPEPKFKAAPRRRPRPETRAVVHLRPSNTEIERPGA